MQGFIDGYATTGWDYFIGLQKLYSLLAGKNVNIRVYGRGDTHNDVVFHNVTIINNSTYNIALDGFTQGGMFFIFFEEVLLQQEKLMLPCTYYTFFNENSLLKFRPKRESLRTNYFVVGNSLVKISSFKKLVNSNNS